MKHIRSALVRCTNERVCAKSLKTND